MLFFYKEGEGEIKNSTNMTAQRKGISQAGRKSQEEKQGVRGLQQGIETSRPKLRKDAFLQTHADVIQPKSQTDPFISGEFVSHLR